MPAGSRRRWRSRFPDPGVIGKSLRWLVNPSGPLWIRPTLSPALLDWIARFTASCSRSAYTRGLATLQRAAAVAGPAFDRLADRGVEFEHHDQPLLYTAFERGELELLLKIAADLREAGSGQALRQVSADELRELEPALGPGLIGGVIAEGERRVRPELVHRGPAPGRRGARRGGQAGRAGHCAGARRRRLVGADAEHDDPGRQRGARGRSGLATVAGQSGRAAPDRRRQGLQPHVRARPDGAASRSVSGGPEGRGQRVRRWRARLGDTRTRRHRTGALAASPGRDRRCRPAGDA